jgi:bifunctional UDP-N-acetylglucosamine pyrophosphorylase / glucosamine-1-phosphate N-acetyltransferase
VETDLDILIMAAGLGTRMKSNQAKVLHELDGRPLVNHICETASLLEPRKIYVVVGHQADDVQRAVLAEFDTDSVVFVLQKQQLGTGDAVNAAREYLADQDGTLLVLSGDVPMIKIETLREMLDAHDAFRGRGAACTLLSVRLNDPFGYGRVVRDGNDDFQWIVEQRDASEDQVEIDEINAGIYCFNIKKLFDALAKLGNNNAQGEYYLTDIPQMLLSDGEDVAIFQCKDPREVEGVNDRRQLAEMERRIRELTLRRLMIVDGVTFIDPSSAYVSSRAVIGRDTVIYPNVTIEGNTQIGEGCLVHSGTRIVNSMIGNRVEVRDNCLITDSTLRDECTIGPMAHLRGHADIGTNAKIGNFVEVKKSKIGRGTKASHLTYLGDATLGDDTNIGAGTITCNYDGKRKHETHIGSGVRIGSDTMLIAPVTVGDGAVTGAGSVVTKDVEANTLVAGVPAKKLKDVDGDVESAADPRR